MQERLLSAVQVNRYRGGVYNLDFRALFEADVKRYKGALAAVHITIDEMCKKYRVKLEDEDRHRLLQCVFGRTVLIESSKDLTLAEVQAFNDFARLSDGRTHDPVFLHFLYEVVLETRGEPLF